MRAWRPLERLSVWTRLTLVVSSLGLGSAVILGVHLLSIQALGQRHEITRLEVDLRAARGAILSFFRSGDRADLDRAGGRLSRARAAVDRLDEPVKLDLEPLVARYQGHFDRVVGAVRTQARAPVGTAAPPVDDIAALAQALTALDRQIMAVTEKISGRVEERLVSFERSAVIALLIACLLGVGLIYATGASIVRPLRKMVEVADRIAAGDFEVGDVVGGGEEMRALGQALDAISTEVRERRRAESELEEVRHFIGTVVDSSVEGVIVIDLAFRVLLVNRRVRQVLGPMTDSVIGRPITSLMSMGPVDEALARLRRAAEGEVVRSPDVEMLHPVTGDALWYSATSAPLRGADDQIRGVVISLADVTARREHETGLEAAKRRAEEAIEAKSRFLANMSHEIRTPLNGVIGTARWLADETLSDEHRGAVGTIVGCGEHLLSVINAILDHSKLGAGRMRLALSPTDLPALLESSTRIVEPVARAKDVEVRFELDPEIPPTLLIDSTRLKQVLLNLLGNAVKFTREGEVCLRAKRSLAETPQGVVRVAIEVSDTGPGIPKGALERLFDAFEQVDGSSTRSQNGTGLGLAIAQELIRLMGGHIEVKTEVGVGSTFGFEVELTVAERVDEAPAACAGSIPEGLRVLVAEDNRVNQVVITRLLSRFGVDPTVVEDGAAAVAAVEDATYDVVLMDVQMPGMNGLDATREIRGRLPDVRQPMIVALTANALPEDRDSCLGAGMNAYLAKPVRLEDLERVLVRPEPTPTST